MSKVNAYLTKYNSLKSTDLSKASQDDLAKDLWLTPHDYSGDSDYVLVGTAEVKVNLLPAKDVVTKQVDSLRKRQKKLRAEAAAAHTSLEREIQQLLAITNDVAGAAA